jgi:hypothetical protein
MVICKYCKNENKDERFIKCFLCREKGRISNERYKCIHRKRKHRCRECNGVSLCIHDRLKEFCISCGGKQICEHKTRRSICKICKGGGVCFHNKIRTTCKICSPFTHLKAIVSCRVWNHLKNNKHKKSIEYLGCNIQHYREYLENQFLEDMTWENYGELWEIDHIIPIMYNKPDLLTVEHRLHYKNTQPLYVRLNRMKKNRLDI